jgi:hypothetical protein
VANSISTSGTTPQPLTTTHQSGQSVREWVGDHSTALANSTPTGDQLTTTWPSANGTITVTTNRVNDESDATFIASHVNAYLLRMIEDPPVP